jgi:site-specific recombinase XerD
MNQIENLFARSWIAIDRMKRGATNHKAFLTPKGSQIIKKRARDFQIILSNKEDDSYVFTPQYAANPLNRTSFTKIINKFLKESAEELSDKPNTTSHSFRVGFITQLWRDTKGIEFVRQAIGHAKIDTTSRYVQNLTEEERKHMKKNENI